MNTRTGKLFVVGSVSAVEHLVRRSGLDPNEVTIVVSAEQLFGLAPGTEVWILAGAKELQGYQRIMEFATARRLAIVDRGTE